MKKYLSLLLAALLLVLSLPVAVAEGADTITVTDDLGISVTVPADIQRVAVCNIYPLPSVLAVFFGSADKMVGMAEASMTAAQNSLLGKLYPEILNARTDFITASDVNVEELLMLDPDVVFYSASEPAIGEKLTGAGFAAVAISVNKWDYDCIETLDHWIALLDQMFPDNSRAKTVEEYSDEIYDLVQSRVSSIPEEERARVFFLFKYTDSTIVTSGDNFFGDWWAESIGAVNVAKELTGDNAQVVNLEQVYAWNPDVIYLTNFTSAQPADLYGNTVGAYDWSGISAVENQRVYKMPLGMYRSYTPGLDTPVTLLWLAKTTYPDLFTDIDVTEYVRDYYETVFGVSLTDEQAESIFAPASDAGTGF